MVVSLVTKSLIKIFGSRNERFIKSYARRVEAINACEADVRTLTDAQLKAKTAEFRGRIESGEKIADLLPEVLAVAREAMDRAVGIRSIFNPENNFDPQRLDPSVRPVFERIAKQAAELEDIEEMGCAVPTPGWMQVEIPNEIYDAVRELYPESRPPFRARPFDVQLIGGMVLSEGKIAEMKTGEGKTIVAPLACYINCVENMRGHVVTVNDYLVQRDRDWVFPFFRWLGLTVGSIHPFHMQPGEKKQEAYHCDVVYGTNSEFGFDYLRDNMKLSASEQVQKNRDFVIVDEVDSILIDEARTPLIISGPAHDDAPRYELADNVARHLMQVQKPWTEADKVVQNAIHKAKGLEGDIRNSRDKAQIEKMREEMKKIEETIPGLEAQRDQHVQYYELELEKKAAHLTHDGIAEAQKVANIGSFYVGNNMDVPHLLENALRAHAVYTKDKDYVVQNGEVIIVDEFTGRLMIGRQWSDGLHQAVESKERVKIKEETQTLATVTIQNFFKLYKRIAGMTGTAITEATEFMEVYHMDVVCVPTNKPVIRHDYNDIIYLSEKDKWYAIMDEIKLQHDVGRPVLVGTTSVEASEMLSQMLTKKHGIKHEVLNAKQHEREANIVEDAGKLGAVMIATNMAGRGTDIRLRPIAREEQIHHWQQRDLIGRDASPEMSDEELVGNVYRHIAQRQLGIKPNDLKDLSDQEVKRKLLIKWVNQHGWKVQWPEMQWWEKVTLYKFFMTPAWHDETRIEQMSNEELMHVLDQLPSFLLHRLRMFSDAEDMGGLHIIGTERHESRRIDNQLRGRAGRQGDQGSSRFFISLEDDLMRMFAGKTTLAALSKLGMKEGDAIEHRWLTKSVERAQRKVEERNYEIRKNLVEYDEVMEVQRNHFYGMRQDVLEGRAVEQVIFDFIYEAITDATSVYLDKDYVKTQVAEWCRNTLDVSIDPTKLRLEEQDELEDIIRRNARAEAAQVIDVTIGEYMSNDMPPEQWDTRGLSQWAMSRFNVDLKQNQIRQMNIQEVQERLVNAAHEQIDKRELTGVVKYLDKLYAQKQLVDWVDQKFGIEIKPEEINLNEPQAVTDNIFEKARDNYLEREVTYPVDFALDMTVAAAQQDGAWAAKQLANWANHRYAMELDIEELIQMNGQEVRDLLVAEADQWLRHGKLETTVDEAIARDSKPEALVEWFKERFGKTLEVEQLQEAESVRDELVTQGRRILRTELTELERFVLLQILDMAWKDHLYAMDQLKDSVGLRGYAEKDPRIEYKREGSAQFAQMQHIVRDRVTELIFRARLTPDVQQRSVYDEKSAQHDQADGQAYAAQSAQQGTAQQQEDMAAADRAGGAEDDAMLTRKQRRARAAHGKQEPSPNAASGGGRFRNRKRKSR
ncbi:MAG: preprotein translocase subunit SecA [Phycisphaeraceae bacterium]|nr:preprotein translocase subunit SecA [Phycisphaeraceae bacterium]